AIAGALLLAGAVGQADAQTKRRAPAHAASVTIANAHSAPLQELEITSTTEPPVVVARLTKPLEPGKSVRLAIKGKHGCLFDLRGAYGDESVLESDGVDLCADNKLRLTE